MTETKKGIAGKILTYFFLSIWALTTVFPFLWVLISSFKRSSDIRGNTFALPIGDLFTTANYELAFERNPIFDAYRNSLIISGSVTIMVILIAGLFAYGLARYNFKFKSMVYSIIVASMMFPVFSTIIPVFRMQHSWGIANTGKVGLDLLSVILPQIAGNLSFSIIVLVGFIKSIPVDMEEAAFLEGFNIFQIYFKIILPLARPSFATVAIFTFLWSYNDLFTQMFFIRFRPSYTITKLLSEISSQGGVNYGLMAAAVVLVVVPVLIIYVFLQKNIIKGMTAGAVKG